MKARLIGALVAAIVLGGIAAGSSGSRVLTQAVKGSTKTTVKAFPKPAMYGQPVKLTATVTRLSGTGKLSGKVTFYDGLTKMGQGDLQFATEMNNVWMVSDTNFLAVRPHSITAVYSGNSSFAGSKSPPLRLEVRKAATTTVLDGAQLQTSVYGEPVTFTATVTAKTPRGGTPSGRAQFSVNVSRFDPYKNLSLGKATLTTSSLAVGANTISATYSGDANFAGSTSRPLTQTVGKAATTLTVSSSVNESPAGLSYTITVTPQPSAPGAGSLTGTVQFANGTTMLGSAALSGGKAVLTTKLPRGATVTVTYSGDANFTGSSSSVKVGG